MGNIALNLLFIPFLSLKDLKMRQKEYEDEQL
jgi:hypothetical protein